MKSSTAKVTALITYMKEEEEGKVCVCMRGGDEDIPQPNSRLPYLTRGPIFNRAIHTSSWNKKRKKKKWKRRRLAKGFRFFYRQHSIYIYIQYSRHYGTTDEKHCTSCCCACMHNGFFFLKSSYKILPFFTAFDVALSVSPPTTLFLLSFRNKHAYRVFRPQSFV